MNQNENLEKSEPQLIQDETQQPPIKVLKKRGRKPSGKVLDIKSIEEKHITSSLDPEKECLIIHLPINTRDIDRINKNKRVDRLEKITETPTETEFNSNIFMEIDEKPESKSDKELLLTSELQLTETVDNKKRCYNCQYLSERCNALHQKLQEVSNIKNIHDSMINKIHDCKLEIVDSEVCKWKEKTNLCCWWCVHKFDNPPFGLPIKFENNKYEIQGCFCSLNCAKAYNIKENNYRTSEINSLIEDFRRELFGEKSGSVQVAPPRQTLNIFGGYLTIEDFRKEFYIMNKNIIHLSPTVAPVRNYFEEEYHDKFIRANATGDRVRLKRNTAPPQVSYNLDKIMNNSEN
jgi:hypothetical protein